MNEPIHLPALTRDEQNLFHAARLPWFIRAWLWSLYPVALDRGRLAAAVLAGCIVGSAATIAVPLVASTLR